MNLNLGKKYKYQKLGKKLHNATTKQISEPRNSNSLYPGILYNTNTDVSYGELLRHTEVLKFNLTFKYTTWIQNFKFYIYIYIYNALNAFIRRKVVLLLRPRLT